MKRWRARGHLVILSGVCIAAGIAVPFLPENARTDVLAGGLVLGGLAMLVVALVEGNGHQD